MFSFSPSEPAPDACYVTEQQVMYFLYRGGRKDPIGHQLTRVAIVSKPEDDGA